jgi:hypothetical protein
VAKKTKDSAYTSQVKELFEGKRCWLHPKDGKRLSAELVSKVDAIRNDQYWRKSAAVFHSKLYDGAQGVFEGGTMLSGGEYDPDKLPFNVVRNGIDTLVALLAKNRPLPQIVTDAATFEEQERAKLMTKGIEGELYRARFWQLRPLILRDSCVFGNGIVHVYRKGTRIFIKRVLEPELLVDRADGMRGEPRCMYYVYTIDRFVIAEEYGGEDDELREKLLNAKTAQHNQHQFYWTNEEEDRVLVVEAWRLPDNADTLIDGAKPVGGRHTVVVDGCDEPLLDEPYNKPYHPFHLLKKCEPQAGFYGSGVAQELAGFQAEIDMVADKVQIAHHLMGGGHVFLQVGSEIVDTDIQNGVGCIIKYRGQPPVWHNPQPVNPDTYRYLTDLPKHALAFAGISTTSAQGERPPGVTAARALLVLDDIETQRFQVFARADEDWIMSISFHIVDLIDEIVKENKNYEIKLSEGRDMLRIPWGQLALDRDCYVMQMFPTSLLGRTPAARLQYVQDLFNAKVIDKPMFLKLLDAPDINSEMDLEAAGRAAADEQIEHMLGATDETENAYQAPDQYQDLIYSMHRAQAQLNHWKVRKLPSFNQRLLVKYILHAKSLLDRAMQMEAAVQQAQQQQAQQQQPQAGAGSVSLPEALTAPVGQGPKL